jgi:cell division ATPase FtsA
LAGNRKKLGRYYWDIGAGTTTLVVPGDGEVQHVAVLPIGGMHTYNDLAIAA